MKKLTQTQIGEIFIFMEVFLWSLFPVVTTMAFANSNISAIFASAISTLIAALFFAVILTIQKRWSDFKVVSAWKDILIMTLLIGIGFYGLIFIGIEKTSASEAGIIMLMEIFFSLLLLHFLKKELLTKKVALGAILMLAGAILVLYNGEFGVNPGNLIILLATMIAPMGNYYSQQARAKVSSSFIMFVRSLISGIFLLAMAFAFGKTSPMGEVNNALIYLVINGIFLLGLTKIFWIEAIHRIPITKAISFSAMAPVFTIVFAYFLLKEVPTFLQICGFIPVIFGAMILTEFNFRKVAA